MSTRRPIHVIRPRQRPLVPSLTVRLGRNLHGHCAVVAGHPGVWSAHSNSALTAVVGAAWKVWFTPSACRRVVWEMVAATTVADLGNNSYLVSLSDTNTAALRTYLK